MDGRKQPIRGLWIRGARYYARLNVENPLTGIKKNRRVPLIDKDGNPVQTVAQAVAELKRLHTDVRRTTVYVTGTVEKETTILNRGTDFLGGLRLDQIKRVHVNRFIESRLKENVSPRTINLDVIGLRVVLKRAMSDGLIQRLPTEGLRSLKTSTKKRSLFTGADLDTLCKAAFETKKNKKTG